MGTYVNNGKINLGTQYNYAEAIREIAALLGVGKRADGKYYLSDICVSPNIKFWAKNKPVYSSTQAMITEEERQSLNYGIQVNYGSELEYRKPIGGAASPYRLRDLDGYNHNATSPLRWQRNTSEEPMSIYLIAPLPEGSADFRLMPAFATKQAYDTQGNPTEHIDAKYTLMAYNSTDEWITLQKGLIKYFPTTELLHTPELVGDYFLYVVFDTYNTYDYEYVEFAPTIEQAFENILQAKVLPPINVNTAFGASTKASSPTDPNLTEKELSKYTQSSPLVVDDYFQASFNINNTSTLTLSNSIFRIAVRYIDEAGNKTIEYLPLLKGDGGAWNDNWTLGAAAGTWAWRVDFTNSNLPKNKIIPVEMWAVSRESASANLWGRVSVQAIAKTYIKIQ